MSENNDNTIEKRGNEILKYLSIQYPPKKNIPIIINN